MEPGVSPHPQIVFSDADIHALPLSDFHVVVLVEPDPETWMALPEDWGELDQLLELYNQTVYDEFDPDLLISRPVDVEGTRLIWVRYYGASFFDGVAQEVATVSFHLGDYDLLDDLGAYLSGLAAQHPGWRVAVIGAMYEDDVIRTANLVQSHGLATTIVARYCISSQAFVDLDKLCEYISWLETCGRDLSDLV